MATHSKREKAEHALKRGVILFGAILTVSFSLRMLFLDGAPSVAIFTRMIAIATVGGLMTVLSWYRKLTTGSLL